MVIRKHTDHFTCKLPRNKKRLKGIGEFHSFAEPWDVVYPVNSSPHASQMTCINSTFLRINFPKVIFFSCFLTAPLRSRRSSMRLRSVAVHLKKTYSHPTMYPIYPIYKLPIIIDRVGIEEFSVGTGDWGCPCGSVGFALLTLFPLLPSP